MGDDASVGAWQIDPEARRQLRLATAQTALRRGDLTRCVLEAEELLDEDPDNVDALWVLAQAATDLRDGLIAREAWRSLIDAGEDRAVVWGQYASACFEVAQYDDAVAAAHEAIGRDPDCGEAHYVLGLVVERTQSSDAAWPHFSRAHRCGPLTWPLPLSLSEEDVAEIVTRAFVQAPPDVIDLWTGVPVHVEPWPDPEELRAQVPPISPRVLALYEGAAPSAEPGADRPPSLRVYRGNLAHHDHLDHAAAQLADALDQEAQDWLAPSDEPPPG